jgi:hypothetical protein
MIGERRAADQCRAGRPAVAEPRRRRSARRADTNQSVAGYLASGDPVANALAADADEPAKFRLRYEIRHCGIYATGASKSTQRGWRVILERDNPGAGLEGIGSREREPNVLILFGFRLCRAALIGRIMGRARAADGRSDATARYDQRRCRRRRRRPRADRADGSSAKRCRSRACGRAIRRTFDRKRSRPP